MTPTTKLAKPSPGQYIRTCVRHRLSSLSGTYIFIHFLHVYNTFFLIFFEIIILFYAEACLVAFGSADVSACLWVSIQSQLCRPFSLLPSLVGCNLLMWFFGENKTCKQSDTD